MDGLVPYGKMVQQRYRRFKIKEESEFDRNQISPDTPYMRELEQKIRSKFPDIILSSTQEPGEGEHKIFNELRKKERKSICVYGLDADLILLSMFNSSTEFTLLRESTEFNDKSSEFTLLSIPKLIEQLPIPLEQYLHLCVLCFGNDFMPNIGMFSLREDGYSRALDIFNKVTTYKSDIPNGAGLYSILELGLAIHKVDKLSKKVVFFSFKFILY
jgi:5'-3' exoribonuclease 1